MLSQAGTGAPEGHDLGGFSRSLLSGLLQWLGRHPYLAIVIVAAMVLAPALIFGMPLDADDAIAHRRWQFFFAHQFWGGEWFPRWLADMNDGFGSPAFFIYPPLEHIVAALFAPLFPKAAGVPYRLAFSMFLCMTISGIGFYRWMLDLLRERTPAAIGAIVYMAAPYHLFVDIYMRGALAELWAFAWAPWTLLAIHLFRRQPARAFVMCVVTAAALVFSHAPTSMFLFVAYFIYAAVLSAKEKDYSILMQVSMSLSIAILLAGIYLGTALSHTAYIDTHALFSGYFDFFKWLMLAPTRWPSSKAEYIITGTAFVQTSAAMLMGCGTLYALGRKSALRYAVWFALIGSAVVFLLMSSWGSLFWKLAFPFQKIQFPWRLLMLQSIFLAMLAACCAHSTAFLDAGRQKKRLAVLLCLVVAGFVLINAGLYAVTRKHPAAGDIGSADAPEYTLGKLEQVSRLFDAKAKFSTLGSAASVAVVEWQPRHIVIDVDARQPLRLALRHFNYPGWQYRIAGSTAWRDAQSLGAAEPVIAVDLPAGRERVEFVLARSAGEQMGRIATLAGAIGFFGALAWLRRRESR